ncbi:MAG TPA: glycosyltransferase [Pyrinomonadaceae bacterium]|nr:glycosyltransferase [Pyrinomonadaceae bacterium]
MLRVAFFTDSYLEVNGVAMTSQRLENFARQRNYPFLTVYAGKKTQYERDGSVERQELKRSFLSIPMDAGLAYDPLFQRHNNLMRRRLEEFRPDVVHITGLNDVSILGAWLAHKLKIPPIASWHTNLHEFAATRLHQTFWFVPEKMRKPVIGLAERKILDGAVLYYKMGKVILAPNQELIDTLKKGTGREAHLMIRGVDTEIFAPEKRTARDGVFRLGFVGRLQPEKNVRLLVDLEKELIRAGKTNYEFLIAGDGSERSWLEQNFKSARFTGFIEGENLSEAYANMDVFVFPSETDAFGNVVQEAFASGVPAIVANLGGPKYIVRDGETGFVAENLTDFARFVLELMDNPARHPEMSRKAREFALSRSWDAVFEQVYQAYDECRKFRPKTASPKASVASVS